MKSSWRSRLSDPRSISIGLLIGLGLIYLPTLSHTFVWDDLTFVKALWPLREPASWWTAVQQPFPITPGYFRPLGVLVLTVQFSLAGRDPALFHLMSVALHVLNTVLVAWLARLAWPQQRWAAVVALVIYGLHPALIEGVAFASSQFDLWVTLCLLSALAVDARIRQPLRRAIASGGLFLLAALFKEMAVVLVAVLPLWQLSRDGSVTTWRARFRERAPTYLALLGAGAIYLALRVSTLGSLLPPVASSVPGGDALQHLLLVARSLVEYLLVIVWPFGTLSPIHYSVRPMPATDGLAWLSLVIGVMISMGVVIWVRRAPRSGWLVLASAISLLPVLNIVPLNLAGGAFVAERFLVFPLALLAVAISGPLIAIIPSARRRAEVVTIGLWGVASFVTLMLIIPKWADSLSLWTWASERAPQSSSVWSSLANEYNQRGDYTVGLEAAQRAIGLNAADEWGWNNAGLALFELGRSDEARTHFEQAIRLAPDVALFKSNLGSLLRQQGQWSEAEQNLLAALAIDPNEPLVRINLGLLYLSLERPDLALPQLEAARQLVPPDQLTRVQTLIDQANQPAAWLRLANGHLQQGNAAAASQALDEAARRGADPIEVVVGRCSIAIVQGNLSEADAICQTASAQAPNDARPINNLGVIAQRRGDLAAARDYFQRAISIQPDWDVPRQNLAQLPAP